VLGHDGDRQGQCIFALLSMNMKFFLFHSPSALNTCYMLKCFVCNPIDVAEVHRGISIKGPHLMMAYIDNATATAASIGEARWMRTGDVAYMEKGKIHITDRAKVSLILLV